jgi:hypothetical protein
MGIALELTAIYISLRKLANQDIKEATHVGKPLTKKEGNTK